MSEIGLLNERALHASLKESVARHGDRFEEPLDRYVIDIVRDDLLIEIQTGSFASIRSKLTDLVDTYRVHLIYPIAREKWILKSSEDGPDGGARRKSPRRGRLEDLFWELVSFPRLVMNPNFTLEVFLIQEEEVRRFVGGRRLRRKRGWRTEERRLLQVVERHRIEGAGCCLRLLPDDLPARFTTKDLATAAGIRRPLAQKMAYCLRKMSALEVVGKRERSLLYQVAKED